MTATEHTCVVKGCRLVVFKTGLCAQHRDDLSSRQGPFARTPPPRDETVRQPASPVKTGDDAWERLQR